MSKSQNTKNILKGLDSIEKLEKAMKEAIDKKDYETADKFSRKLDTLEKAAFNKDNKEFKDVLDDLNEEGVLDKDK